MADETVLCGYCGDPLKTDLDEHLEDCPKQPYWVRRIGLEREGWDIPPEAA